MYLHCRNCQKLKGGLQVMEIRRYWIVVRKWYWLMMLGLLLTAGSTYFISESITPIYAATVTLQVNQVQEIGIPGYSDLLASERLTRTYSELIRQRTVLDPVIQELDLNQVYDALAQQVSVRGIRDTQLIQVTVKRPSAQQAADVANKIAEVFIAQTTDSQGGQLSATRAGLRQQIVSVESEISSTAAEIEQLRTGADSRSNDYRAVEQARLQSMLTQYQLAYSQLVKSEQDLALAEVRAIGGLRIAVPAVAPRSPTEPQVLYNTAVAAAVGLIIAVLAALLLEYLDDTIKTAEGLEQAASLPTLGIVGIVPSLNGSSSSRRRPVPTSQNNGHNPLLVASDHRSRFGESYRTLRTNLQFATINRPCKTLVVTSAGPDEGKTFTLANLAITFAQAGRRVLVVDSDLRRPYLHRMFQVPNKVGLTNLLVADDQTQVDQYIQETKYSNLRIITSGPLPPNPTELLSSSQMGAAIAALKEEADILLLDTPPAFGMADAVILSALVDGTLLVVDAGRNRSEAITRLKDLMVRSGAVTVGTVLNRFRADANAYYYRNYYRYYHSRYGYDQVASKDTPSRS